MSKICNSCNAENIDEAKFCRKCGKQKFNERVILSESSNVNNISISSNTEKVEEIIEDNYNMEERIQEIERALKGESVNEQKVRSNKYRYKEGTLEYFLSENSMYINKKITDTEYLVSYQNSPIDSIVEYINNEWRVK